MKIDDNIEKFLEKDVGPKGSKLSGGEKQRLACVRAMIRRPQIFIMDEGTSALDRPTEDKMQKNLDRVLNNTTRINVAHRI